MNESVTVMNLPDGTDLHLLVRGTFTLSSAAEVQVDLHSTAWFNAFVDEAWWMDGPHRFATRRREFSRSRIELKAGPHTLCFHIRVNGIDTRIANHQPPRFFAELEADGQPVAVEWEVCRSEAYEPKKARLTGVLGWIEWQVTGDEWQGASGRWQEPQRAQEPRDGFVLNPVRPVERVAHALTPMASGELTLARGESFSQQPGWNLFMRNLEPQRQHVQGVWRRYDLGRVRLAYPEFTLDLPAGAVVEFAYSEYLDHGRVCPVVFQSGMPTCFMDHYVARGGVQTFCTAEPRGLRFLEIHVLCDPPDPVRFLEECVQERLWYSAEPDGSFECDDALLSRIWSVGVDTLRCCYEDTPTDTPTRERGQWLGDVTAAGLDSLHAAYQDLSPVRRMLVQAAQCPEPDGLVCGMVPGMGMLIPAFCCQWISTAMHYVELTGDRSLLNELFEPARRNMQALLGYSENGLLRQVRDVWNFIDWGYQTPSSPFPGIDPEFRKTLKEDLALSFTWHRALVDWLRWTEQIGQDAGPFHDARTECEVALRRELPGAGGDWQSFGFHAAVLGLLSGLMSRDRAAAAVGFVKTHLTSCFPNDLSAPVVYCENIMARKVFTPYFSHWIFDALIQNGEMEFVQNQIRSCWGWFLEQGVTTWPEAFDLRWSHSHQYSTCPTWQLSRYVLGLHPRFDRGENCYDLDLKPGALSRASGTLPTPFGRLQIGWERRGGSLVWRVESNQTLRVRLPEGDEAVWNEPQNTINLKC
jgi:alpha-L-rhamnosidase